MTPKTKTKRETTEQEREVMEYLNELRESGRTNMYGAGTYIEDRFTLDSREAKRILLLWMSNFNDEADYNYVEDEK